MKTYLWIIIGCTAAGAFYPFLTNFHWFWFAQVLANSMCFVIPTAIGIGLGAFVVSKCLIDSQREYDRLFNSAEIYETIRALDSGDIEEIAKAAGSLPMILTRLNGTIMQVYKDG